MYIKLYYLQVFAYYILYLKVQNEDIEIFEF